MTKVFALPKESRWVVFACVALQFAAVLKVFGHSHLSFWPTVLAFFVSTYVMDLITGFGHFSFDYVWPDNMPILGPISVEFRQHHDRPMLDPSALISNLTRGSYFAIPAALATHWVVARSGPTTAGYFYSATLLGISLWGLFFHQIHSYTHMGKTVPPDEFNAAVERISQLPKAEQPPEFAKLFDRVGIPKWVRVCQRCRLFLRPEIHWRHHNTYDSDFSSLNGWSDPLTNLFFGPIARYKMRQKIEIERAAAYSESTRRRIRKIVPDQRTH